MEQIPPMAALRAFDAVARRLGFRAAADDLQVTQSAISHQVAELERRLGVTLFERGGRRVALTAAGSLYHPYVRDALERLTAGTALVTMGAPTRELDVQVYVTVAVRWLIPRLHSFTDLHPDVKVRLNTSQVEWEFDDEESDVGIICSSRPVPDVHHATHLFDASLVAVCSPSVADRALAGRIPFVRLYTAPDECLDWLAAAGLADVPSTTTSVDSYLLAIESAIDGQGIAVVPDFLVAADLRTGRLVTPFDTRMPQARRWYLVCRTERAAQQPVVAFRDWLLGQRP
jgi:LysR family glycine cleavage system transcriptional activator